MSIPTFTDPAVARPGTFTSGAARPPVNDLDDLDLAGPATPLDALRAELDIDESEQTVTFRHPDERRAQFTVRYTRSLDLDRYAGWQRRCTTKGEIDTLRLACTVLAVHCQAILVRDQEWSDGTDTLTFRSPALHEAMGVARSVDAVRRFYLEDAHTVRTFQALLDAAGWGTEVAPVDPTQP